MKKKLIVLAAAVFCLRATAQETTETTIVRHDVDHDSHSCGFIIGARYMPTFTSIDLHKSEGGPVETTFVLGHGFSGLIGLMGEHIGVQGEVMYSNLAQKFRDGSFDREVKLHYINVPILLVLNTGFSKPVNLNIVAGPQMGFNTGSSITTTGGDGEAETVHAVFATKKSDIGFAYGAGLDFRLAPAVRLGLGYRGVVGLVDISDTSQHLTNDEFYVLDRSHVRTYAGYIGLTFGF